MTTSTMPLTTVDEGPPPARGGETATPTQSTGSAVFNLDDFRLPQDFARTAGVQRILAAVSVGKPSKTSFFCVRPGEEYRAPAYVLELPEDRETYLVSAALGNDLIATESACRPALIVSGVTREGGSFLWPLKLPGADGRSNPWLDTAMLAAEKAEHSWVRLQANLRKGEYDVYVATGDLPGPEWPRETFAELLAKAFRGKVIDSINHPVLRKLRGEV